MDNTVHFSKDELICLEIIKAFRPKIYQDGNQFCCLYGDNLQEGICAFGENPMNAVYNFYLTLFSK